jgi:hypothetical protein
MKIKFLLSFVLFFLLFSCSSDSNSGLNVSSPTNYFPLAAKNYWKFRVLTNAVSQTDSLYISNDSTVNAKVYKLFKTKNLPVGFFSNSLNKNGLRIDGSKLLLTGLISIDFGVGLPINLSVKDYTIFQEDASNNDQLAIVSGSINETVKTYPLVIDYILKSTAVETLPTFTSSFPPPR